MRIVALSGSLRSHSSNFAALRAAVAVAPEGVAVTIYEGIGGLPHFNPDLDGEGALPPPKVAELRALLASADGVVISCPEYAHGIPGSFKNALDWLVSSGELNGKPVLLINASPSGGQFAEAALIEVLGAVDAQVLVEEIVRAPAARSRVDAEGRLTDEALAGALRQSLGALAAAIAARSSR